ncbi:MAG: hypothetical protein EBU49_06650 [Proteobacteria bacterium]|nr:hypothetical protein [Pseudomonadota bacterium]
MIVCSSGAAPDASIKSWQSGALGSWQLVEILLPPQEDKISPTAQAKAVWFNKRQIVKTGLISAI